MYQQKHFFLSISDKEFGLGAVFSVNISSLQLLFCCAELFELFDFVLYVVTLYWVNVAISDMIDNT